MNILFDTLSALDNGIPLNEANDKLRDLLLASETIGGKGSLTITLKTATKLNNGKPRTAVFCEVKVKKPEITGEATGFFLKNGQLHRDDPNQMELPLDRTVISIKRGRRGAAVEDDADEGGPEAAAK